IATTLAAGLAAQTLVIPSAAAATDGNSSTSYPFDITNGRYLYVYDSSHFTTNGVGAPILISQLALRANASTTTWTGSTFQLQLDISTSPNDFNSITTTWDNNHGPDRATVYNGSFTIAPGSSTAGVPGPFHAVVTFSTPFLYDPNAGDLTIDYRVVGNTTANTPTCDAVTTAGTALAKRVYSTANPPAATATLWSGEMANVLEFTYTPAAGYASAAPYGVGCYNKASTVYESFVGNCDLAGSPTNSIRFVQNGNGGFTAIPGSNAWFTPTSADLLLGDDTLSAALALPYTFPFGSTPTASVKMASNGYLWIRDTETSSDLSPTVSELLTLGPRIAPFWTDLNPASIDPATTLRVGSCHYDIDPVSGNPVFTWLNVPEFGSANIANQNTFQIELDPSGAFEMRWQNLATTATRAIMTAVGYGLVSRDGGATDLSTAVPFSTESDKTALRFAASGRPVLGASFNLVTSEIPANTLIGAVLFGFAKIDPGFDLGGLGAPGCSQYVGIDAVSVFVSTGNTNSLAQSFPNDPAFAGLPIRAQSAVFSGGQNALGLLTSNGVELVLDLN
ncbi:MAG: hypothetical protein RL398_3675, partial [Planctomycetota bacterium]